MENGPIVYKQVVLHGFPNSVRREFENDLSTDTAILLSALCITSIVVSRTPMSRAAMFGGHISSMFAMEPSFSTVTVQPTNLATLAAGQLLYYP